MKKSLSQRRVPRKIGQDDDDAGADSESATGTQIKRPSSKPKKASGLRATYGAGSVQDEEDGEEAASVVAPKRSNLSRLAIQRNASKRSSYQASELPDREPGDGESDAPSYSASDLQALKNSTPSTPQQVQSAGASDVDDVSNSTQALDLSSKFGSSLARYQQPSAIPSATEIAEKKARRARLAKEAEADNFISLDPDNLDEDEDQDENVTTDATGRLILRPKDKYKQAESRLVRDDEDIMEGFDEFTGDTGNRINMGESTRNDAQKRRKEEMAAQIQAAEGSASSSDEDDDSDRERNDAFELAQTRHGNFTTSTVTAVQDPADARPKTPPKISPLPNIDSVLARLKAQLGEMQTARSRSLAEMEALEREKIRIGEEEVRIQKALKETAEKFEALRREKGIESTGGNGSGVATKEGTPGLLEGVASGLGFAGANGRNGRRGEDDGEADDKEIEERPRLGLGMAGRGLESMGASSVGTPASGGSDGGMSE